MDQGPPPIPNINTTIETFFQGNASSPKSAHLAINKFDLLMQIDEDYHMKAATSIPQEQTCHSIQRINSYMYFYSIVSASSQHVDPTVPLFVTNLITVTLVVNTSGCQHLSKTEISTPRKILTKRHSSLNLKQMSTSLCHMDNFLAIPPCISLVKLKPSAASFPTPNGFHSIFFTKCMQSLEPINQILDKPSNCFHNSLTGPNAKTSTSVK